MTTDKNNAAPDPQLAELAEQQGQVIVHALADAYAAGAEGLQFGGPARMEALAAALAATGKQQVGEVQGDARAALEASMPYLETLHSIVGGEARASVWRSIERGRAALAASQPVRIYGCCAQPEGELHTAECPNMCHIPARQPEAQVPVVVEAVATIKLDRDGEFYVDWLTEGGIHDLSVGDVLLAANSAITNDEGYGEVYAAPPAQGIDLGQQQDAARWRAIAPLLSVEWDEDEQLKRWTWIDFKGDAPAIPSPTRQEYASVDEAVDALINQRDAAPGVGNG